MMPLALYNRPLNTAVGSVALGNKQVILRQQILESIRILLVVMLDMVLLVKQMFALDMYVDMQIMDLINILLVAVMF